MKPGNPHVPSVFQRAQVSDAVGKVWRGNISQVVFDKFGPHKEPIKCSRSLFITQPSRSDRAVCYCFCVKSSNNFLLFWQHFSRFSEAVVFPKPKVLAASTLRFRPRQAGCCTIHSPTRHRPVKHLSPARHAWIPPNRRFIRLDRRTWTEGTTNAVYKCWNPRCLRRRRRIVKMQECWDHASALSY